LVRDVKYAADLGKLRLERIEVIGETLITCGYYLHGIARPIWFGMVAAHQTFGDMVYMPREAEVFGRSMSEQESEGFRPAPGNNQERREGVKSTEMLCVNISLCFLSLVHFIM
jgi:hypothetical protein